MSEGIEAEREAPRDDGVPVLRFVPIAATLAVLALVLGHVAAPAVQGVIANGALVRVIDVAGALVSQVFVIMSLPIAARAVLTAARGRAGNVLRASAIALGGFVIATCFRAAYEVVSNVAAIGLGVASSLLGIIAAASAFRAPFARSPAVLLGLASAASIVRLVAMGIGTLGTGATAMTLGVASRAVGVLAALLSVLVLSGALVWIASRSQRAPSSTGSEGQPNPEPSRPSAVSPATVLVLVIALAATMRAIAGRADEASKGAVFFARAADRLAWRPSPGASSLWTFASFVGPVAAIVVLVGLLRGSDRRAPPAVVASVVLILVGHVSTDVPAGAIAMMIASLALALAAHDQRGLWRSLS